MTRLFLDCEFNGFGGQLISMALVGDYSIPALEFYQVLPLPEFLDVWVGKNVVPVLERLPVNGATFRALLLEFLHSVPAPLEVVVDWPSDALYLCAVLLGNRHEESVNLQMTIRVLNLAGDLPSKIPHNALEDARAIRDLVLKGKT